MGYGFRTPWRPVELWTLGGQTEVQYLLTSSADANTSFVRRLLQEVFVPNSYQTRSSTPWLRPGQTRLYSALKIFFELRDEVTLRIPVREVSKVSLSLLCMTFCCSPFPQNWRYDVLGDLGPAKRSSRPFGWLDVKIGADSTVNYVMSMVASESGYDNFLQVHADNLTVFSSANQAKFLFSESCRVSDRDWFLSQLAVYGFRRCYVRCQPLYSGMGGGNGSSMCPCQNQPFIFLGIILPFLRIWPRIGQWALQRNMPSFYPWFTF